MSIANRPIYVVHYFLIRTFERKLELHPKFIRLSVVKGKKLGEHSNLMVDIYEHIELAKGISCNRRHLHNPQELLASMDSSDRL